MESGGLGKAPVSSGGSKAICNCGEGWTCEIKRIEGPHAGKSFFKCGEKCSCVINEDGTVEEEVEPVLEGIGEGEVFCKCGEGWSCVISKTKEPDAGKSFYDCSTENCTCVPTA